MKELEREVRELRGANVMLKLAGAHLTQAELDRRLKSYRHSWTSIALAPGTSRSAKPCRSPRLRTGSRRRASAILRCARPGASRSQSPHEHACRHPNTDVRMCATTVPNGRETEIASVK